MGANANPSGNQDGNHNNSSVQGISTAASGNPSNGSAVATAASDSGTAQALKHNPGIAKEWSPEEHNILQEGLTKFASDSSLVRYAKIAMQLQEKTVRDVVLRCRWMNKKESGKRRKEDHNLAKKSKDKKSLHAQERAADPSAKPSSHLAARPSVPPYSLPMLPMDNDDDISYKEIGGATGQLLESNAQILNQISANIANFQIQENVSLLCQTRDNILTILNDMNDPGVMKQMPPLPVKMNEELANSILPRASMPMQS